MAEIPAPALPDTLAAFEAWRVGPEAPEAGWPGRPIGAQGSAQSGLMILVDLPDREDSDAGVLLSGAVGRLFDRMLAAIGRDRASIYLASVCATRPGAGRIAPEIEVRLERDRATSCDAGSAEKAVAAGQCAESCPDRGRLRTGSRRVYT